MNPNVEKYLDLFFDLIQNINQEETAEEIREKLDDLWFLLSVEEQDYIRIVCSMSYGINNRSII
jgi:hypothetical protein